MALSDLGKPELLMLAERIDDIAPDRVCRMELDAMLVDRLVDQRLDPLPVALRRAVRDFGAAPIGLVDHERDHLRHAFERRRLVGRQGQEREKILQESLFERQWIFTADLQVEGVELVARRKLHSGEDRLMSPRRAKRLL